MATSTAGNAALGPIRCDETYPLVVFMRLAGLSTWAMREARRNGLKVRKAGRRRYIDGADWREYLRSTERT